jgi:hypothetical protein
MSPAPRIPSFITDPVWRERLTRWWVQSVRWFHAYAAWLVGISWWRFAAYGLVLWLGLQLVLNLPPFTWKFTEQVVSEHTEPLPLPRRAALPRPPQTAEPAEPPEAVEPAEAPASAAPPRKNVTVQIDETGVRIRPRDGSSDGPIVDISPAGVMVVPPGASAPVVDIRVPQAVQEQIEREIAREVANATREAARAEREALREKLSAESERIRELEAAKRELEAEQRDLEASLRSANQRTTQRVRVIKFGEFLEDLALLFILASALIKGTYKGRKEAEAKAAAAEENAEAEALKRQLVEARLQTMQAQVEPHFLFNTLASIDHLIEIDPVRASQMQKNLIALLRASMPTMREANGQNRLRDLKKELAVVRPYLEILSVRMEERLQWRIDVPEGLLSAEFPPMIIQGLVENAIKHGLEPKPEGGSLTVSARIEHGDLVVEVADTGLGFGRAATAGTGVGLANTRERLQLLYGAKGSLTVAANQPSGTLIRIQVPYSTNHGAASAPSTGA